MKILAPASSADEAKALISAGAEEIYCGLHPAAWRKKYGGEAWLNRRGPGTANISSLGDLERLAGEAHRRGVPVYLTMNLPFYLPGQYPELISLAGEVTGRCGIDALIIGDPGLIYAVKDALSGVPVHVSSLAAVLNSASASFFRDLGASRIIFPRYMDPGDMGLIMDRAGRQLEYEAFVLNDGCVFEEGLCHVSHAFGGAFCHHPWSSGLVREEAGRVKNNVIREPFEAHMRDCREWLWYVRNCGGNYGPGGYPLGMCGLCALPGLKGLGLNSLKIVGREAPLPKKTASVRLVKKVMEMVNSGEKPDSVRAGAKKTRGTPGLCNSGYMCYYR